MTLLLTSQKEQDLAYNYTNHFQNTIKIEPNSEIALNHATVNRQRVFKYDADRVFFMSHSHELPECPRRMRDVDAELALEDITLEQTDLIPFVHYPFPVIVPTGVYGMKELAQQLESSLNNPDARYGGDYWPSGSWNVTTIEDATSKDFLGFNYDWNSTTDDDAKSTPTALELTGLNADFPAGNFTYTPGTGKLQKTGGGLTMYDVSCVVERWMSTNNGVFEVDITATTGPTIIGLSRWTDGISLMPEEHVDFMCLESNFRGTTVPTDGLQTIAGSNFYDYAMFIDDNQEITLWQLNKDLYSLSTNIDELVMQQLDYVTLGTNGVGTGAAATVVNTQVTFWVRFRIDNEMVAAESSADDGVTWDTISVNQMKPINNYTCQMTPKISLSKSNDQVTIKPSLFVKPHKHPIRLRSSTATTAFPTDANGNVNVSSYNHFWGFVWCNTKKEIFDFTQTPLASVSTVTNSMLEPNLKKYWNFNIYQPDFDSTVATNFAGAKWTTVNFTFENYWWAYVYTAGADWQYNWNLTNAGEDYTFGGGNYIIPYNCNNTFFSVRGNMNNTMGIQRLFFNDVEITFGGDRIARIVGDKDLSSSVNDILYLRINLGNILSGNGQTSSLSRIIAPIIADGELSSSTGLRSFKPEKMYLKLNNTGVLMIDHIRVEIVTDDEKYADSLGGTTSASFHIRKSAY
jgi:hypothetical protein